MVVLGPGGSVDGGKLPLRPIPQVLDLGYGGNDRHAVALEQVAGKGLDQLIVQKTFP